MRTLAKMGAFDVLLVETTMNRPQVRITTPRERQQNFDNEFSGAVAGLEDNSMAGTFGLRG
jgi:hypothetical protein